MRAFWFDNQTFGPHENNREDWSDWDVTLADGLDDL